MAEPLMLESAKAGASNPATSGDNQQLSTLELLGLGKAKDGSNLNVRPADIGAGYRQLDQSKTQEVASPKGDANSNSLFDDAYNVAAKGLSKSAEFIGEHKVAIGITGAVGSAVLLHKLNAFPFLSQAGKGAAREVGLAGGQTAQVEARALSAAVNPAAATAERDAVLKQVGVIPDTVRPAMEKVVASELPQQFKGMAASYGKSIGDLRNLPATIKTEAGQSIEDIANKLIADRMAVTGERASAKLTADEVARITANNPGKDLTIAGQDLVVYTQKDLVKLAETTQFKHLPQLGQLLKQNGVTEEQIQAALKIQASQTPETKQLLGQILQEQGLATKAQVDGAFSQQNKLKDALKAVRQELGFGQ